MSRVGDRATAEYLTQEVFMARLARAREDRKLVRVGQPGAAVAARPATDHRLGAAEAAMAGLNPTYRNGLSANRVVIVRDARHSRSSRTSSRPAE